MKRLNKAAQEMGRKGGLTKGKTKSRGDSEYYRKIAMKSVAARKRLRNTNG